jgi:hypothetical protein
VRERERECVCVRVCEHGARRGEGEREDSLVVAIINQKGARPFGVRSALAKSSEHELRTTTPPLFALSLCSLSLSLTHSLSLFLSRTYIVEDHHVQVSYAHGRFGFSRIRRVTLSRSFAVKDRSRDYWPPSADIQYLPRRASRYSLLPPSPLHTTPPPSPPSTHTRELRFIAPYKEKLSHCF